MGPNQAAAAAAISALAVSPALLAKEMRGDEHRMLTRVRQVNRL